MLIAGLIGQSGSAFGTDCASITINFTPDSNMGNVLVEYMSCKTGKWAGGPLWMKSNTWNDAAVGSSIRIFDFLNHNFTPNEKVQPGANVFTCPHIDDLRVGGRCPRKK